MARELTKIYEQLWWGTLAEAAEEFTSARGEVTLVLAPSDAPEPSLEDALALALEDLDEGASLSSASREAAASTGVARRLIYQELLDRQARS